MTLLILAFTIVGLVVVLLLSSLIVAAKNGNQDAEAVLITITFFALLWAFIWAVSYILSYYSK